MRDLLSFEGFEEGDALGNDRLEIRFVLGVRLIGLWILIGDPSHR